MDVQTPAARRTDPDTSHEADEAVTRSGRRHTQREKVADALTRWPGRTTAELAEKMGTDRYMVARRMSECETAGDALRGQKRRCNSTGKTAETWWPKPRQVSLL